MSLLEAPCAKTSWRALLFRAIFGIIGVLIVYFDIWRLKQTKNNETGIGGYHCDFEQHVPCLTVHVCMNSVKFVLEAPSASILWGRYYSLTMCRLTWGGASIRKGASNRDIMVLWDTRTCSSSVVNTIVADDLVYQRGRAPAPVVLT